MQTCPLCGEFSLEQMGEVKQCLRNGCPCYFAVDSGRAKTLRIQEEVTSKAIQRASGYTATSELSALLQQYRRELVSLMEGDTSWDRYSLFLTDAKNEGAFGEIKVSEN